MKDRTQHVVSSCALASDTMEALRRKEQEIREEDSRRRRELEQWADQLRAEQEQQKKKQEKLLLEKVNCCLRPKMLLKFAFLKVVEIVSEVRIDCELSAEEFLS